MATEGGRPGARLTDRLVSAPEAFEVFEAVRILEDAAARESRAAGVEPPPELGGQDSGAGMGDRVRFAAAATLSFPGAAVVAATPIDGPGRRDAAWSEDAETKSASVRLEVATFGLIGPTAEPDQAREHGLGRITRLRSLVPDRPAPAARQPPALNHGAILSPGSHQE